jgi:hypothetical protein
VTIHSIEGVLRVLDCAHHEDLAAYREARAYLATLTPPAADPAQGAQPVACQWRFRNAGMPEWSVWKDGAPPPPCKISQEIGEHIETRNLYPHPTPHPAPQAESQPATPEQEREVDEALGLRLLKVRVPVALADELHTEADYREVPLTVVLRERLAQAESQLRARLEGLVERWRAAEYPPQPTISDDEDTAACAIVSERHKRADELRAILSETKP